MRLIGLVDSWVIMGIELVGGRTDEILDVQFVRFMGFIFCICMVLLLGFR